MPDSGGFSIPSDAYESYHDQPNDQVLWLLHAQADVPGVNYFDDFEFRFSADTTVDLSLRPTASFRRRARRDRSACLPVRCLRRGGSGEPKSRGFDRPDWRHGILLPAFSESVPGSGFALLHRVQDRSSMSSHIKAPWFFTIVFGLFELLLIYGVIQQRWARSVLRWATARFASVGPCWG